MEQGVIYEFRPSLVLIIKNTLVFALVFSLFLFVNFRTPFIDLVGVNFLLIIAYGSLFGSFVLLVVLVFKILKLLTTKFEITDERIIYQYGIFSVKREYMELYRVKDFSVSTPFWLRLFSLANLIIYSSDKTHPVLPILAIKDEEFVYDGLRERVETMRKIKGVREFD